MNKRMLIISAMIAAFALYQILFPFHEAVPLKRSLSDFPLRWNGWVGGSHFFDDEILEKLRVSEYVLREYKNGHDSVVLYVGYYSTQREGAQIHSPKHCLPGGGWFKISENIRSIDVDPIGRVSLVEAVYQKGEDREVFIYWYKMKDAYITNEYLLKLYMVINSLLYRRNDAAFIRFSAPVNGSVEDTVHTIERFMKDFLPPLKDYLPE